MESEKLRKCESFGELRAGTLVRVMPCRWCGSGRGHRSILESFDPHAFAEDPDGSIHVGPAWINAPLACLKVSGRARLGLRAVAEGRVYIIETGVDKETTREAARELEGVR